MILADFRQVQEKRDKKHDENRTNNNPNKQPHAFAHTTSPHMASQSVMNTQQASSMVQNNKQKQKQNTVLDYISELGIGNVEEFFMWEDEKKRREQKERDDGEKGQRVMESVQRLYETGVGFGKKMAGKGMNAVTREGQHSDDDDNHHDNNSQPHHNQHSNQPYYTSLYPLSPDFTHHFLTRRLQTCCQKFRQKLWSKFLTKYEIWVASDAEDRVRKELLRSTLKRGDVRSRYGVRVEREVREGFVRAVVGLVVGEKEDSKGKSDNEKSDKGKGGGDVISTEDSFFARYSDYLNQHKLKHFLPPSPTQQQPPQQFTQHHYHQLKLLAHTLPFVYYFMDFQHLQRTQDVEFKKMKDLERWVIDRYETKRDWERMCEVFEGSMEVKVTVPFQTKLYQVKRQGGDNDKGERGLEEQEDDDDMSYQKFKANPIPPTTYKQPQTRPASSKKPSTQPIPFNFTHPHPPTPQPTSPNPNLHPAPFKATPIPATLYQPQLIGINPQQKQLSKKQHMQRLYHQSKFPKTMGYLENYVEFQERVRRELEEKVMKGKERGGEEGKVKKIPDFEKLHRKETLMLETRKEINRVNTQPKPFNFTQTSKRSDLRNTLKTTFIIDQELLQQSQKKPRKVYATTSNIPPPKSTAKFAAYTQLRKLQRQQNKQSILQKQQAQKRKQSDMKVYKDILKQRMMNELSSQPKPVQYDYGKAADNVVRVDLEGIYVGRPLLMEGSKSDNKGRKYLKDDERTCYTDGFEPII